MMLEDVRSVPERRGCDARDDGNGMAMVGREVRKPGLELQLTGPTPRTEGGKFISERKEQARNLLTYAGFSLAGSSSASC